MLFMIHGRVVPSRTSSVVRGGPASVASGHGPGRHEDGARGTARSYSYRVPSGSLLAIYLLFVFDRDCSTERPGVAPRRSLEDQGVVGLGAGCFEGTGGFGSNGLRSSSRGSLGCG